ncbi:MAG: FG-GAP repeat protein [Actinomycetota bacterium]
MKTRKLRTTLTTFTLAAIAAPLVAAAVQPAAAQPAIVIPPVHIAVGAPKEDVGGLKDAGTVTLLVGGPLSPTLIWSLEDLTPIPGNTIVYRQGSNGISGTPERGDRFGHAVVLGDFNGDRTPDIAISAPGEDTRTKDNVGVVHVVHGRDGVAHGGRRLTLHPGRKGVPGGRSDGDRFGESLTIADLNGDGYDELIVGTPRKDHSGAVDAGEIHVFFGSEDGLTTRSERIRQGVGGIPDQAETGDRFGQVLASQTGSLTLAVGIPREDVEGVPNAGAVQIIAPTSPESQLFLHQGVEMFEDQLEPRDQFGRAVSLSSTPGVPDFFVSIGAPYEDFNGRSNAGIVHVLSYRPDALSDNPFEALTIDLTSRNYKGEPKSGDRFGWSLIQRGTRPLVGVPGDDPGGNDGAGSMRGTGGSMLNQNTAGVPDSNEPGDAFGQVGAASPYRSFFVFGVPKEDVGSAKNAGMVLFESRDINAPGWLRFDENSRAVPGAVERFDRFGDAVAVW